MNQITSLYLYGTAACPANKISDSYIRPNDITYSATLTVNAADFMENGGGRYATPYEFEVVGAL